MKNTIQASRLLLIVTHLNKACDPKSSLPILSEIAFISGMLCSTNLNMEMHAKVNCLKDVVCTLNAAKLIKILKTFGDDKISIVDGSDGKVEIYRGNKTFTLNTYPVNDFPAAHLNIKELRGITDEDEAAIGIAHEFCGSDELRPIMSGVHFRPDGIIESTNAHMAFRRKGKKIFKNSPVIYSKIIKMYKTLTKKSKYKGWVQHKGRNTWSGYRFSIPLYLDVITVLSRDIEGKFPNIDQVWPEKSTREMIVSKWELQKAVTSALIVASQNTRKITFSGNGTLPSLTITSEDEDFDSQFKEQLYLQDYRGDEIKFALNGVFTLLILKHIADLVKIDIKAHNRAVIFNKEFLLMPVILD